MELLGYSLMFGGVFFFWVSGLGLIRMPDVFTRMHAGAKATTMGSVLMLSGAACLAPDWAVRLLLLALFILLTNPLSSSVLARAAHRSGSLGVTLVHDAQAEREAAAESVADSVAEADAPEAASTPSTGEEGAS